MVDDDDDDSRTGAAWEILILPLSYYDIRVIWAPSVRNSGGGSLFRRFQLTSVAPYCFDTPPRSVGAPVQFQALENHLVFSYAPQRKKERKNLWSFNILGVLFTRR